MSFENIIYEKRKEVVRISLNRPEKLNAMNDVMLEEFNAALDQAEADTDVTAIIIKGTGRAFCSGYDVSGEGTAETDFDFRTQSDVNTLFRKQRRRQESIFKLARYSKSTIAQVHGNCVEMGCSLVMACDISFADENAQFCEPSVRMGLTTDMPLWYHLIGVRNAKEMLLTGKTIDGREAERIGIITKAVPADMLEQEADEMALTVSLTPFDGLTNNREGFQMGADARGVAEGWRSSSDRRVFGILQRPGSRAGEFDFLETRDKKGLKAALEEMNAPYRRYGY
ncbi:MAG: enoyl-CoA hydratase/isomerase family protein [Desulfobacterium sp.]|nr:enoyl-CoA hydratase/isomerase family protein [Desulfobacteraceae bacterium]MBA3037427.1 enoyl-CoA hydratase/isomerase family protein [Desulfobacterium sp.]